MKISLRYCAIIVITIVPLIWFSACKRSPTSEEETPDNSTYRPEATPATDFEQKMKFVRDGHFAHVWVFARLDGRPFTKEDTDVLHTNAPKVVDWVGANEGKTFIADSNFDIEPAQMALLRKRYKIEDYSGK